MFNNIIKDIFCPYDMVFRTYGFMKFKIVAAGHTCTGCFFSSLVPPLKVQSTKKLIKARLGVSKTIYVNVDTPNLGFTYFYFLGGYQLKN